jgi:hypothetical protein
MGLKFGTLWFGNKPTLLQEISWNSYIYHGHELSIYLYDMSIDVPSGAIKKDANEIILEKDIVLPTFDDPLYGGGHAQFCDIFRIHMLKKTDLIWTDSDVVCLKDVWPDPNPYLFGLVVGKEYPEECPMMVNNDILYINNKDAILDEILDNFKNLPKHYGDDQTITGPDLLTRIFSENNLMNFAKEENVFHAVRYPQAYYFSSPTHFGETMDLIKNSVAVSLFAGSWLRNSFDIPATDSVPDENTVLGYLANKYIHKKSSSSSSEKSHIDKTELQSTDQGIRENALSWFAKDRSETANHRTADRKFGNEITIENPALGINIYKRAIPKEDCAYIVNALESNLGPDKKHDWRPAMVTEADTQEKSVRNCVDFKIGRLLNTIGPIEENLALYDAHQIAFNSIFPASQDYGKSWGVGINWFEAFNFVKYDGPGTHFKIHADHGPAYVCTTSIVAYLNDDYEGGEIYFPRFDLTIKPEPGDIVIFPSTYIYEHASQPMKSGTKYSIVVMTDYNDRGGHRSFAYREDPHKRITY